MTGPHDKRRPGKPRYNCEWRLLRPSRRGTNTLCASTVAGAHPCGAFVCGTHTADHLRGCATCRDVHERAVKAVRS